MFRRLSIVCLGALIYASPSFAQWTCSPSNCNSPTQIWASSTSAKVGVGTSNPLAIFHSHTGTNSNFALFNSLGGFGFAGVLIDSVDDTGGNVYPMVYNASKHVFASGNVGINTNNPSAIFHSHQGTNSNLELFNSLGGFGFAGVLMDSLDDSGNLYPMVYNASKHIFASGPVVVGISTGSPLGI